MQISSYIKSYILLFLTRKKPINFNIEDTKKILFFRYDRIGDMIITTPVFRELKRKYPYIKITVIASKSNYEVLQNNPNVDNIVVNNKNNFIGNLPSLIKLRKQKFDVCVEFDHSVVPHAILRLRIINAKINISIKKDGRYGLSGEDMKLYDIYTKKQEKMHFRDIWLGLLEPFDVKPQSTKYDLFISEKLNNKAKKFLYQYSSNFLIGINLEGAVKGKKISFSELYQICKKLNAYDTNIQIFILTTPQNYEFVSKRVKKMALSYVGVSYKTDSIQNVSALISHLDLIITPDTSIAHVASVYNKPVISIHENNQDSYQLFRPTSSLNRTVFSSSKDSLKGFSLNLLFSYCKELINLIKKDKL